MIADRNFLQRLIKVSPAILLISLLLMGCLKTPWDYHQAGIHMNLGMAYIEATQYTPALKELLEAEKYTPDDVRIHFYLGIAYHGNGFSDKAVDEFKKAIDLKPDYSEAHNFLGIIYSNAGQWDMAIASFNRALANIIYDTPAAALYNMGWAYYQKGDYLMAASKYGEALRREPNTMLAPLIYKNRGLARYGMGHISEAMHDFRQTLATVPDYAEAQYWLAECHIKKKNWEEAKTQFQALVTKTPDSEFGLKAKRRLNDLKQMK